MRAGTICRRVPAGSHITVLFESNDRKDLFLPEMNCHRFQCAPASTVCRKGQRSRGYRRNGKVRSSRRHIRIFRGNLRNGRRNQKRESQENRGPPESFIPFRSLSVLHSSCFFASVQLIRSTYTSLAKLFPAYGKYNTLFIKCLELAKKGRRGKHRAGLLIYSIFVRTASSGRLPYSCGPAFTSALPASLTSYFVKFLMNRAERSFAFSSHWEASA